MISLIQHSQVLRRWYVHYQTMDGGASDIGGCAPGGSVQTPGDGGCAPGGPGGCAPLPQGSSLTVQPSLAYCEPRFDSAAKPLAIAVLTIDAVLLTAIRAVVERKKARTFGRKVSEFRLGPRGGQAVDVGGHASRCRM